MDRRNFLSMMGWLLGSASLTSSTPRKDGAQYLGVLGPITRRKLGTTLIHEHIMVDFIGADQCGPHRYQKDQVIARALFG